MSSLVLSLDDEATWFGTTTYACPLSGLFKKGLNDEYFEALVSSLFALMIGKEYEFFLSWYVSPLTSTVVLRFTPSLDINYWSGILSFVPSYMGRVQTLQGAQPGFGIQPRYKAPSYLWVKISIKSTVINIGLVRMSPWHWPKVAQGAATQQIKKHSCDLGLALFSLSSIISFFASCLFSKNSPSAMDSTKFGLSSKTLLFDDFRINSLHFTICEAASKMISKLQISFDTQKRNLQSEVAKCTK